jgi:hypothetical protein
VYGVVVLLSEEQGSLVSLFSCSGHAVLLHTSPKWLVQMLRRQNSTLLEACIKEQKYNPAQNLLRKSKLEQH